VEVYVRAQRAAEDAATSFRRAIEATGVAPGEVTIDGAAAYPPALAAVLPEVLHETSKLSQQRIERDQQHLKGRVGGMRGFTTLTGARVRCSVPAQPARWLLRPRVATECRDHAPAPSVGACLGRGDDRSAGRPIPTAAPGPRLPR
jgi:hypothetical protein